MGGIDVEANFCYVATPSGQAGFTFSAGGGLGFPVGFGAMVGPTVSNADNLNDLSGPFDYLWGSAGEGPFWRRAFEWGKNGCGDTIWQETAGWTPGIDLPTPFSFGGGINNTWTAGSWF